MGRTSRTDYKAIEQEYVTTGASFRELGRKYALNFSTIAAKARSETPTWMEKRDAYTRSLSEKTYDKISTKVANEDSQIRLESIIALRVGIRKFAENVATGKVQVSASDAAKMVDTLARLLSESEKGADDSRTIVPVGRPDADGLRAIVEAARGRLDRGRVLAGPAGPGAEGARPN